MQLQAAKFIGEGLSTIRLAADFKVAPLFPRSEKEWQKLRSENYPVWDILIMTCSEEQWEQLRLKDFPKWENLIMKGGNTTPE